MAVGVAAGKLLAILACTTVSLNSDARIVLDSDKALHFVSPPLTRGAYGGLDAVCARCAVMLRATAATRPARKRRVTMSVVIDDTVSPD